MAVRVVFLRREESLLGFRAAGHTGLAPAGEDILCAAVSSALLLAANTLTDAAGCKALVRARDGDMLVSVTHGTRGAAQPTLRGLAAHLQALEEQFPRRVYVTFKEVF